MRLPESLNWAKYLGRGQGLEKGLIREGEVRICTLINRYPMDTGYYED